MKVLNGYNNPLPSLRTAERSKEPSRGCPKIVSTTKIIAKIQDIVLEDRQLSERDLIEALGMSLGTVSHIWGKVLVFRKLN